MITPQLQDNAVELTPQEAEALFGRLTPGQQAQLADLLWECPSPEARQRIYATLRNWRAEMLMAEGVRL